MFNEEHVLWGTFSNVWQGAVLTDSCTLYTNDMVMITKIFYASLGKWVFMFHCLVVFKVVVVLPVVLLFHNVQKPTMS